jgi:hypothetical protein
VLAIDCIALRNRPTLDQLKGGNHQSSRVTSGWDQPTRCGQREWSARTDKNPPVPENRRTATPSIVEPFDTISPDPSAIGERNDPNVDWLLTRELDLHCCVWRAPVPLSQNQRVHDNHSDNHSLSQRRSLPERVAVVPSRPHNRHLSGLVTLPHALILRAKRTCKAD